MCELLVLAPRLSQPTIARVTAKGSRSFALLCKQVKGASKPSRGNTVDTQEEMSFGVPYQSTSPSPGIAPSSHIHTAQTHRGDACCSSWARVDPHPGKTVQILA